MIARPRAGRSVQLGLALLRVAIVPVVLLGEDSVDYPAEGSPGFSVAVAATAVWALGVLVARLLEWRGRWSAPAWLAKVEAVVDLAVLAALTATSGGAFSQARKAFFVVPFAAAMRTPPLVTAGWSVAAVLVYLGASAVSPTESFRGTWGVAEAHALYLLWAGAFAVFLSAVLDRRGRLLTAAARDRDQLATQALDAEQRERQRLAEALHDDAVQNLLAARQELAAVRRDSSDERLARVDEVLQASVAQLRGQIFELHPYVLDHAGLEAALRAMADDAARRSGAHVNVRVDAAADGPHNTLVTSLVRELLTNAVKHASARHIAVEVERADGAVLVAVRDDGVGVTPSDLDRALADGHIGLAAVRQRAAAVGGSARVDARPEGGTSVEVRLPAE